MVDVEEFGDSRKRRLSLGGVAGLTEGTELDVLGGGPGHDGAGFVFAKERYGGVQGGGRGVGGEGRGPDQLRSGSVTG